MMYEYAELENSIQITYSDINEDNTVRIEIERPRDWGFDSASCMMPAYTWIRNDGFSDEELVTLTDFLQRNAPLIFRLAHEGQRTYT